jgi:hypothetical protein
VQKPRKLNYGYPGVTVNAIVLCGYAIGNAAGPFMWKKRYQPRNHVPWAIIATCSFVSGIIALIIRFNLARENKRRDAAGTHDNYDDVYLTSAKEDGTTAKRHIDRAFLDLTDRYVSQLWPPRFKLTIDPWSGKIKSSAMFSRYPCHILNALDSSSDNLI